MSIQSLTYIYNSCMFLDTTELYVYYFRFSMWFRLRKIMFWLQMPDSLTTFIHWYKDKAACMMELS